MKKTVVVTGATGFVGKKLSLELMQRGYSLRILSRNITKAKNDLPLPCEYIEWNGQDQLPSELFENTFGVIHLSGEPIAERRWNKKIKESILSSRTVSTKKISEAIENCQNPPEVFVGTSAIGFYGERGDELLTEDSSLGEGFLAEVCNKWENSYAVKKSRLAILRVGVVLGHGGALLKMLPPFRMGVGGKLASGKQWMSWIHIDDLIGHYIFALENKNIMGTFNAVAAVPVQNDLFTKVLGKALGRPTLFPVPKLSLNLIFGEMSEVLLNSQRVSSNKISLSGYVFKFPQLKEALENLLRPTGIQGAYIFESFYWVKNPRSEVFAFFSQAKNLEKITPAEINFRVQKLSTSEIEEGTLIDYSLKIKGVPLKWKTLIKEWRPQTEFVDEQLKGPYKIWNHTHTFLDLEGGTLMLDRVIYKMPMGMIGDLVRQLWVQHDVARIFSYRATVIKKLFL